MRQEFSRVLPGRPRGLLARLGAALALCAAVAGLWLLALGCEPGAESIALFALVIPYAIVAIPSRE